MDEWMEIWIEWMVASIGHAVGPLHAPQRKAGGHLWSHHGRRPLREASSPTRPDRCGAREKEGRIELWHVIGTRPASVKDYTPDDQAIRMGIGLEGAWRGPQEEGQRGRRLVEGAVESGGSHDCDPRPTRSRRDPGSER